MKKTTLVTITTTAVLTLAVALGSAIAQSRMSVTSTIGQGCSRNFNSFTVPTGTLATAFRIEQLESGRSCGTNQIVQTQGFQIRNSSYSNVYTYTARNGTQTSVGLIEGVLLPSGTYSVSVDGGSGAIVTLSFIAN